MKAGIASGDGVLATANAMRRGTTPTSALELWRLADRKSGESRGDRVQARLGFFRHAMIHAGLIRTRRGTVYRRCGMCREKLV